MKAVIFQSAFFSLIALLPMWTLITYKWPLSYDLFIYAQSLHLFSEQLWSGDIYPRWLYDANDGTGAPIFIFYPPVAFYVASIFQPLATFDPNGIGRVLLTAQLFLMASVFTCFCWLKAHMNEDKARIAALFYGLFPYTLIQFYNSYQFAVIGAMSLLPLWFYAIDRVYNADKRFLLLVTVCAGGILSLHILTFCTMLPIVALYSIVFVKTMRPKILLETGCATALGIGIAALYWYPAIINTSAINSAAFTDGHFDWRNNFYHPFGIAFGTVFIVIPLLGALLDTKISRRQWLSDRQVQCFLCVLTYGCFMASPLSWPIWEHVPMMDNFQFPFRFLFACAPATVFLIASLVETKKLVAFARALVVMAVGGGLAFTSGAYAPQHPYPEIWEKHQVNNEYMTSFDVYQTTLASGEVPGVEFATQISLAGLLFAILWGIYLFSTHKKRLS